MIMTDVADISSSGREPINEIRFSVIVPVYNSTEDLRLCLAALSESDYKDFEVIVVDDGSTEPVEPLASHHGFRYMKIAGPHGPARARNQGVEVATGQYVVFIDSDVCVRKNTLTQIASILESDAEIAAVVGAYDEAPAQPDFISQYKNLFHHYTHRISDGEISTFWSGCGAMRRDLFVAFGGFDEQRYRRPAIEDIELGTWMKAEGHRIILDSRIEVKHLKRWTFWNLLKTDIFDRGIPWTRLMMRAGKSVDTLNLKPTQRFSVVLVYLIILSIPLSVWWPILWVVAITATAAVTILNLDLYKYFAYRRGLWFMLRVLPMHWLYFVYCGFSAIAGTLLHYAVDRGEPSSSKPQARAHS